MVNKIFPNLQDLKGENFLNDLAICMQDALWLSPNAEAKSNYTMLLKYMFYTCEDKHGKADLLYESLPSYGLSEEVRREIINIEMAKYHPTDVPDYIGKIIVYALYIMNYAHNYEEGGEK